MKNSHFYPRLPLTLEVEVLERIHGYDPAIVFQLFQRTDLMRQKHIFILISLYEVQSEHPMGDGVWLTGQSYETCQGSIFIVPDIKLREFHRVPSYFHVYRYKISWFHDHRSIAMINS